MAAPTTTTNALLEAALEAARSGVYVFPLHSINDTTGQCTCTNGPDCHSPGKHPRTKNGLDDATINPEQITKWWSKWPEANVGLRTGAISHLYVIDVDGPAGEQTLDRLVEDHGPFPDTLTALTGGDGMHLVFRHPGRGVELGNTSQRLGPKIDTRGDGGYIVAPPSRHASGNRYEWLNHGVTLAELPAWVADAVTKERPPSAPTAPSQRETPGGVAPTSGTTRYAQVALDAQAADVEQAAQGSRNHALNAAAFRMGQLIAGGQIDEAQVIDRLTAAAATAGIGGKEVANTIRSGLTSGAREPQYPDPARTPRPQRDIPAKSSTGDFTPPPPDDDGPDEVDDDPKGKINETDLGNARRLIRRHGHELRYATHLRGWLRWDGTRWAIDDDGYVERCAHATAQSIMDEARGLHDTEARKKRFAWSIKSEGSRPLEAMVRIASRLRGVAVGAQDLDADPWLLNVRNGTLDLHAATLRPHDPRDLLTKIAPVDYDPDASDDRWDAYLSSAIPDDELRAWLQRAIGYTLTGLTVEEVLFFVHGPTQAGKSTFLESVKAMLGDYARNADFETFLDRDHGGTARSDIARLAGARLVTSNEVDEGRKLAEGLVKTLTGGDTITARFLYRDEFEYMPQFKLILAANHKPKVRHGDDAIWRRIRLVPFIFPPVHPDPTLKTHLVSDGPARKAILRWAVEGCAQWQTDGLVAATAVRVATEAYRAEMDPLAEFFEDHCYFNAHDPECWVTSTHIRSSYEEWAKEEGLKHTLSPKHFKELLEERGCTPDRRRIDGKTTRIWMGVRLLRFGEEPKQVQLEGVALVAEEQAQIIESSKRDARDGADATPMSRSMRGRTRESSGTGVPPVARVTPPATSATPNDTTQVQCVNGCGNYCTPTNTAIANGWGTVCSSCTQAEREEKQRLEEAAHQSEVTQVTHQRSLDEEPF